MASDDDLSTENPAPAVMDSAVGPLGQQIGDYRLLRELGRGGMGVVFEAEQLSLNRRVALKILPPHVASDQGLMSRFQREARAAARLHHTNIVPVFEIGQQGNVSYYAMQLIRGQALDEVLRELRRLRQTGSRCDKPDRATPRGSIGAQTVAQSLAAGRSEMLRNESAGHARPTAILAEDEASAANDRSFDMQPTAALSGTTARIARAEGTASSAVLPGQREATSASSVRRGYYRSVALVGTQVADALAHAHRAGILHRDIKPSNLLLDPDGRAWITDFGLAKTEDDDLTRTGDVLGTLRYMPPERFGGWSDPRSDIYSLGVTLYEMLALRPAFDEPDRLKLIHQIAHSTPARLRQLDPLIPADLETIIFKAIDRGPSLRYTSADELKADLQRFLDDKPITARRATHREQVWRWCRRNPAVASLAGTLAVLLVVLAIASTIAAFHFRQIAREREDARDQAVQSEAESQRNFRMARDAVDRFLIKVTEDPRLETSGLETLRRDLLETAQEFYAQLVEYDSSDPDLRAEQGEAFRSLATITKELGSLEEASTLYRRSEEIFRGLSRESPEVPDYRAALANACSDLGRALREVERTSEAEAAYDEALRIRQQLVREHPEEPRYRHDLHKIRNDLGILYFTTGRRDKAESAYREALRLVQRLSQADAENVDYRLALGIVKNNLAVLHFTAKEHEAAENALGTAIEVYRELAKSHPDVPGYQMRLAMSLRTLGNVLRAAKRADEAEAAYQQGIELGQRLMADHPDAPYYQAEVVSALSSLGSFYEERDQQEQAERTLQQASELGQQLAAKFPDMPKGQIEAAHALYHVGRFYQKAGREKEAEAAYSELVNVKDQLTQMNPDTPVYRRQLSAHLTTLGNLYIELEQYDRAEETLRSVVELDKRLAEEFPDDSFYQIQLGGGYANLGRCIRRSGETKDGLRWTNKAIRVLRSAHGRAPEHLLGAEYLVKTLMDRAVAHKSIEREEKSLADYRSAVVVAENMAERYPGDANWPRKLKDLYFYVSMRCESLKRYEEADQAFAATRDVLEQLVRDYPDSIEYQHELGRKMYYIGRYLRLRGQAEEALEWLSAVIEALGPLHERSPEDQTARKYLRFAYYERARSHDALGNEEEASAARTHAKAL